MRTAALGSSHTVTHNKQYGAGNGTRTRDPKLGRLALYQLSYSRLRNMVEREGFEPSKASPADLQSAPFGHSGTSPYFPSPHLNNYLFSENVVQVASMLQQFSLELAIGFEPTTC
jgi:hypothetical protein